MLPFANPEHLRAERSSRAPAYALWAVLLALGAPTGWMLLRLALGAAEGVRDDIAHHVGWYAYLTFGSGASFAAFGVALGLLADRLEDSARTFKELALSDALTGLRNRRYFEERLLTECARADRDSKPLALIAVDLDLFKRINDSHGHLFGDHVLAHAGRILRETARLGDVAARTGGEEFAVLCPGAYAEDALRIAERFRAALSSTPVPNEWGVPVSVTASIGVSVHSPYEPQENLLLTADRALYAAKDAGRNRVVLAPHTPGAVSRPAPGRLPPGGLARSA